MTSLVREALSGSGLGAKDTDRSKNMFALGLALWLYSRPVEPALEWVTKRFARNAAVQQANLLLLRKGYHYGETVEAFAHRYEVAPAPQPPGRYRAIRGAEALALGPRAGGAAVGAGALLRHLPDHARLRSAPRTAQAQELRRVHDPGRGRDRRHRHGHRRELRRRPRHDRHERAGHGAQDRGDGPGRDDGAAPRDRGRAARRSFDRPAHQDRAERPAPGHLRAQRRGADAGPRRQHPRRLLRDGLRGRAHRCAAT